MSPRPRKARSHRPLLPIRRSWSRPFLQLALTGPRKAPVLHAAFFKRASSRWSRPATSPSPCLGLFRRSISAVPLFIRKRFEASVFTKTCSWARPACRCSGWVKSQGLARWRRSGRGDHGFDATGGKAAGGRFLDCVALRECGQPLGGDVVGAEGQALHLAGSVTSWFSRVLWRATARLVETSALFGPVLRTRLAKVSHSARLPRRPPPGTRIGIEASSEPRWRAAPGRISRSHRAVRQRP